jgi:WD40 repeat protein
MTDRESDHAPSTHKKTSPALRRASRTAEAPRAAEPARGVGSPPSVAAGRRYDVFLSHNSSDKPAVFEIAKRLRKAGVEPFVDAWHLVPGEPWQEALEGALDASRSCAVFLGPKGFGPWENEEMRAALSMRVSDDDYRVIPVLLPDAVLPERGRLPRFLSRLTWVDFRPGLDDAAAFDRLVSGIRGLAPDRPSSDDAAIEDLVCPFRGLEVFDERHAEFFFGREALTQHLVEQLRDDRFLAVLGPSGSGKSSVVRAGLVPALRRGEIHGSEDWRIEVLRPGQHPMEALAARLVALGTSSGDALGSRDRIRATLEANEPGLHSIVQLATGGRAVDDRVALIVDQFEEIFTLTTDGAERAQFVACLLYASSVAGGATIVVLTMRADFFGKCAAIPGLASRLSERDVLVPPMEPDELRRAMIMPAERVGLQFEKGLVDTILADLGTEPGTLPLLQHTLLELFDGRRGRWLTTDRYRAIGGVKGAIAQRAEAVFARLTPAQQVAARRILLRLTQPGEGTEDTRRRASVAELLPSHGSADDVERVVNQLADARLLITSREPAGGEVVDVAHEALIRGWPRLQSWIDQDPGSQRVHRRISEAATEWAATQREASFLYRGTRLREASAWANENPDELNDLELAFLRGSQQAEASEMLARQRRGQRLIAGLVAVAIALAGLGGVAFVNWRLADTARATALRAEAVARARYLVAEGQRIAPRDPIAGLGLVVEGIESGRDAHPQETGSLDTALGPIATQGRIASLGTDIEKVYGTTSADTVVVGRSHDTGQVFRTQDGGRVVDLSTRVGDAGRVDDAVSFGGPGGLLEIRYGVYGPTPSLLRLPGGTPARLPGDVLDLAVSLDPAQSYFVVNYAEPPSETPPAPSAPPSVAPPTLASTMPSASAATPPAVPPEATLVPPVFATPIPSGASPGEAPGRLEPAAELRRTSDAALVATLSDGAVDAEFSPDAESRSFVVRYELKDGELRRTTDGKLLAKLPDDLNSVAFSSDPAAAVFVGITEGSRAELRRTADGSLVTRLTEAAQSVTFSPDGSSFVVSYGGDAPGELRRANGDLLVRLRAHIEKVAFQRGPGHLLVVDYEDRPGELWEVPSGRRLALLTLPISELTTNLPEPEIQFSPEATAGYVELSHSDRIELRHADTGALVRLSAPSYPCSGDECVPPVGAPVRARFSGDASGVYFVGYASGRGELRRAGSDRLVPDSLGVEDAFFPPLQGPSSFIDNPAGGSPAELRSSDGKLLETLPGAAAERVFFSPDGRYAAVSHAEVAGELLSPGELVDLRSGAFVTLDGPISGAEFSSDSNLLVVAFGSGRAELWSLKDQVHQLADLGVGVTGELFDVARDRLVVWYSTGDGYLLDLAWLQVMGQKPSLTVDDLLTIACEGPLNGSTRLATLLAPYLNGESAHACQ